MLCAFGGAQMSSLTVNPEHLLGSGHELEGGDTWNWLDKTPLDVVLSCAGGTWAVGLDSLFFFHLDVGVFIARPQSR